MSTRKNAIEEALAEECFLNLNATKPSLFIVLQTPGRVIQQMYPHGISKLGFKKHLLNNLHYVNCIHIQLNIAFTGI